MKALIVFCIAVLMLCSGNINLLAAETRAKNPKAQPRKKVDSDADGKISVKEWLAAPGASGRFKRMDKNNNNNLEPEEIPKTLLKRNPDMDKNKNKNISHDEWNENQVLKFKNLDSDNDGFLTRQEMAAAKKARNDKRRRRRMFFSQDKDKNGKISIDEWCARKTKLFKKIDKNADKKIDKTELNRSAERFLQLDMDKNGVISPDEWTAQRKKQFKEQDVNQDGNLVPEELKVPERRRHKGKKTLKKNRSKQTGGSKK